MISTSLIAAISLFIFQLDTIVKEYSNSNVRISYESREGLMTGSYSSYYPDGSKKAEGTMYQNIRIGEWQVWDQEGNLKIRRKYSQPLSYSSLLDASATPTDPLTRNAMGYFDYRKIEEADIAWVKRSWRIIGTKENPEISDNNRLFQTIISNASAGELKLYSNKDDEFRELINPTPEAFQNYLNDAVITGYKIKEDNFFDLNSGSMETRIIGICPITKESNESDLFWIYYPELRPILAKLMLNNASPDYGLENLEDYFHFRTFTSTVYKENGVNEIPGVNSEKRTEQLNLDLIEREHNWWLKEVSK